MKEFIEKEIERIRELKTRREIPGCITYEGTQLENKIRILDEILRKYERQKKD